MVRAVDEFRLRLPSGRESSLTDVMRFCYDLSDTDTQILVEVIKGGVEGFTVEEVAERLKLSKATANRSLNKLVELGFILRRREKRQGVGRPRYKYYVDDPRKVVEKIKQDLRDCSAMYIERLDMFLKKVSK